MNQTAISGTGEAAGVVLSGISSLGEGVSVVETKSNTTMKAYIDGIEASSATVTNNTQTPSSITVGSNNNSLHCYSHIKSVKIYDFALNATEVKLLGGTN